MVLHRISFDTNESAVNGPGYSLGFPTAVRDLANIPGGPQEGMRAIIYMVGEMEVEAILNFDPILKIWNAIPIQGTERFAY